MEGRSRGKRASEVPREERHTGLAVARRAAALGGRRTDLEAAGRSAEEEAGRSPAEEEAAGRSPAGEEADIGRGVVDCSRRAGEGIAGAAADTGRLGEGSRRVAEGAGREAGGIAVRSPEEAVLQARLSVN